MIVSGNRWSKLSLNWTLHLREARERDEDLTRDESRFVVGACWTLLFLEKTRFCGNIIVLREKKRKLVEGYDWRK
jgi:hypothetical protein